MHFIRKLPIPMAGLILAIVSLGNFLMQENLFPLVGELFVWLSIALYLLLSFRFLIDFQEIRAELKNPIIASVAPTFTMATFGIAMYLHQFSLLEMFATILWYGAITLHISLMIHFTYHFVIKRDFTIHNLYPSWFITYIGIGVIALTSPSFSLAVGKFFFILAVINLIIILPLVLYRVFATPYNEKPNMPLLTLLTAPTSLCLSGYLTIYSKPTFFVVILFLIVSQSLYVIAIYHLPNLWRLPFYPSFAAFTFPLAVTSIALKLVYDYLQVPLIKWIAFIEIIIAILVTATVLVRYTAFIMHKKSY